MYKQNENIKSKNKFSLMGAYDREFNKRKFAKKSKISKKVKEIQSDKYENMDKLKDILSENLRRLDAVSHSNLDKTVNTGQVTMIKCYNVPYYIQRVDEQHLILTNNLHDAEKGIGKTTNIDEHVNKDYYNDVKNWLMDIRTNIYGKEY